MPNGSNTLGFIPKSKVPTGKMPTYGRLVCDIKTNKIETHRTRLTIGGNLIKYPGEKSTATADLITIKCQLNAIISERNARFCNLDIKKFYLGTPLQSYEYMKVLLDIIPEEILSQYCGRPYMPFVISQ